jgi:hypothetical protein
MPFHELPTDIQAHIWDMVETMHRREEEDEQRARVIAQAAAEIDLALAAVTSILFGQYDMYGIIGNLNL